MTTRISTQAAASSFTSALWHTIGAVGPGQETGVRVRTALDVPARVKRDVAHGRAVAAAVTPGRQGLLVVDDRLLEPERDSASYRLAWVLRLARDLGYATFFHSTRARRWYGVVEDGGLAETGPPEETAVAWVVRPEAGAVVLPALSALRPRLRVVYDSMDLHYLRLARESQVTGSRGRALQSRLMKTLEARLSSSADVAVAITDDEAPLLERLAGGATVAVLPNIHAARADAPRPFTERAGLLFVGNFTHPPNVDAVQILAREVMPRLWRRRPDLVLTVAGRSFPDDLLSALDRRIEVHGWVQDLDELMERSCALVAPLRFGAGLKGKVGHALARGLPAVTTPVGAEGFTRPAGMLVAPAGDWDAFAQRTLELLDDRELWSTLSAAGIDLVRGELAPEVMAPRLAAILSPEGR